MKNKNEKEAMESRIIEGGTLERGGERDGGRFRRRLLPIFFCVERVPRRNKNYLS